MTLRSRLALILLFFIAQSHPYACEEVPCSSIFIQNAPNHTYTSGNEKAGITQEQASRCTVIEGDFGIFMITANESINTSYISFPNVREITGSLWIFQALGLKSINDVLPNLRVIGGQTLLMHYSLVVFQNAYFEDLGLTKLAAIRNGGVRIMQNDLLCNTRNIDWTKLTFGVITDIKTDLTNRLAKCDNTDPICGPRDKALREEQCSHVDGKLSCWNSESCQMDCKHGIYYEGKVKRKGPGCDPNGNRCHESCFGGCERVNDPSRCYSCRNVMYNGRCVDSCPPHLFEYMRRRCVTEEECHRMKPFNGKYFKALEGKCDFECPEGYTIDEDKIKCNKCTGPCLRVFSENITVDTIEKAMELSNYHIIEGYLEISLYSIDVAPEEKLIEAFEKITEIRGYLLIRFTPAMRSLNLLPKLRKIHGKQLYRDRYAFVIIESENLDDLEPGRIEILNGTVMFNNNQKLCPWIIDRFLHAANLTDKVDDTDVSPFSNGDGTICAEEYFTVNVTEVFDYGFILRWEPYDTSNMDHHQFFGYAIYYKSVVGPSSDVNLDDERSNECSDSWQSTFFSEDSNKRITHGYITAQPNTYYAFYVEPRTNRYTKAKKTVSKTGFVKTKFGIPSVPMDVASSSSAHDKVEVTWKPPTTPRGVITHYQVSWSEEIRTETLVGDGCSSLTTHYQHNLPAEPPKGLLKDTCSATKGCCQCEKKSEKFKRHISFCNEGTRIYSNHRNRRSANFSDLSTDLEPTSETIHHFATGSDGSINVTTLSLTLTNMRHFTYYVVGVRACQDVSVEGARCSAYKITRIRTMPNKMKDLVDVDSIRVYKRNATREMERIITWEHPEDPNGVIFAYTVSMGISGENTASVRCITKDKFDEQGGMQVTLNAYGTYYVKVRTVTMSKLGEFTVKNNAFRIKTKGWSPWIWVFIAASIVVFIMVTVAIFFYYNQFLNKRMQKYWRQTVSANPDYISQLETYRPDEWEIPREALEIHEEIGRGTFGKVLRGCMDNYRNFSGQVVGECAIKTVHDDAPLAEQIHFLLEGSVMKKFGNEFIVKLYGIVSNGSPPYVIMEMMANGNLRDFLRAHRPGAEENVFDWDVPDERQFFLWAVQIADGMAYLQSVQFVHRDLAARNCMVNERGWVKIGDFGMARDVCYQDYYKPTAKRKLPIRWMAPESLKDGKFSLYSDVWSYGIVIFELLTLGAQPYPQLAQGEVFEFVANNRTMGRLEGASDVWNNLMKKCWKLSLRQRPTFFHIVHYLLPYVQSNEFAKLSIAYNDPDEVFTDLYDKPYNFDLDVDDIQNEKDSVPGQPFALSHDLFTEKMDIGGDNRSVRPTEEVIDDDNVTLISSSYHRRPTYSIASDDYSNGYYRPSRSKIHEEMRLKETRPGDDSEAEHLIEADETEGL
ncbi:hypothetical protein QR680_007450 [Steinernema hermaphroditum]|uniref:receptor protein-tyrosine kinase n=1 Tax=Steinernema hermaphroditum TaxID=289476 RepID=A0AA39IEM8_9BILA|nr:hypothetical protein QR680_007450 [Steinernema hermaphroditum]